MSCSADVSILLSNQYVDNYVPQQQLDGCSMTRPFLSAKGVACETTPGSPPESLDFFASSTDNKDAFHYGKHLPLFEFCVKFASMNNKISVLFTLTEFTDSAL